ncbi:MAG TPA: phosphoribosylformimino-5-aminoimidazole carboxamide ribotide isomerase [Bacillota bacterium]
MKFRPCIDLHQGKVKQIVGSSLTDNSEGLVENFISEKDASYYAALFKADGLTGGHLIMLGPGNENQAKRALETYPGGLQIGGGITPANASAYLEAGASHVIVTSYVFQGGRLNYKNLEQMVATTGRERLVLDLSCRQRDGVYYVVTDRWQKFTQLAITPQTLGDLAQYCAEFLVHGVDAEGKRQGILEDLVTALGNWAPIPTTYAGGVRSLADLELIKRLGQGKIDVTIGSALDLYGGNLPYREVLSFKY